MSRLPPLRLALFLAGLLVSAWMVARTQFGGDQLNLLARGWLWAAEGELVPWGNPLSSGGNGPGAVTTWLVGAPLFAWMDARAPVVLTWLTHLVAFLLLDRALRPHLSETERLAFVAVYWLNPWRLEASAFLWNPNFLFLCGALHLVTAMASRERPSFGASLGHVVVLGVAVQLHPGAVLAVALSALLWLRGYVRVHWGGFAVGAVLVAVSLAPWWLAAGKHPEILAAREGFPFRGLVLVAPLLKGLLYILRYGSLALNGQTTRFDFSESLGAGPDAWLTPLARALLVGAGAVTLALSLAAAVRFLRARRPLAAWRPDGGPAPGRRWLEGYAVLAWVAACLGFAAVPTTPQAWQGLVVFHAATLPVVFGVGGLEAAGRDRLARRAVLGFAALALALDLALLGAGQNFRCSGRSPLVFPLRSHSPMLDELGLQRRCPWPLDVRGAWWPDVLPEGAGSPD
jgi:hypothetical protein